MIHFLALLILGFAWMQPITLDDPTVLAAQAERAYLDADYSTAVILYEQLRELSAEDSALYYNLGIAHFQNGSLEQAMLYLLRANALNPRDASVGEAITQVRAARLDIQGDESVLIDRIASLSASWLTQDELMLVTYGVWLIACISPLGWLLWGVYQDWLRLVFVVFAGATLIFGSVLACRLYVSEFRPAAVVLQETAIYSGPDGIYLPMYDLHPATEVRITQQVNGWGKLILPDGRQGWVALTAIAWVHPHG
ncbi:MAG: hypothetical protein ACOYL5_01035 [Phototrophicaceae bacterium]